MTDLPALEYFIGCYFHQDYAVTSGSAQGTVDDFVRMDRDRAVDVVPEIRRLLTATDDEAALESVLVSYGLDYDPTMRGDWPSHRDWLVNVAEQIGTRLREHEAAHETKQDGS